MKAMWSLMRMPIASFGQSLVLVTDFGAMLGS